MVKLSEDVRQAKFSVNKKDDKENIQYRILAVMLSSVPVETRFGRGYKNLDSRLDRIIKENSNPLIGKYFHIKRNYNYSPEVHDILSVYSYYGSAIGLENWGCDYNYQTTKMTHEIAREIEELSLFSNEDLEYLKELGKKLLTDESVLD